MKTKIRIDHVIIDNIESITKELEEGKNFELLFYDATDEQTNVGVWLAGSEDATIMFDITKEQALFFGKSLVALAESI